MGVHLKGGYVIYLLIGRGSFLPDIRVRHLIFWYHSPSLRHGSSVGWGEGRWGRILWVDMGWLLAGGTWPRPLPHPPSARAPQSAVSLLNTQGKLLLVTKAEGFVNQLSIDLDCWGEGILVFGKSLWLSQAKFERLSEFKMSILEKKKLEEAEASLYVYFEFFCWFWPSLENGDSISPLP